MAKKADIGSKRLISLAPNAWVQWVLQRQDITAQDVLSAEFQWISRESDVLVKACSPQDGEFLLLNEIQLRYTPRMPRRMRAYAALAEERYNLPVYPVLINLLPPGETAAIATQYTSDFMGLKAHQDYRVINLWEISAQIAFQASFPSLLPFVPIMRGGGEISIIQQAVQQLRTNEQLSDLEPLLAFFARFVLAAPVIQQILRWDMVILRESPWYEEIRREEALELVLRQLIRRLRTVNQNLQTQVRRLTLSQLEDLGEALLDFSVEADLIQWLEGVQETSPIE